MVEAHGRFGTAEVRTPDGGRINVARTRAETLRRAGRAARRSRPAGIDEDLARRDFTVNAVAVSLPGGDGARRPGGARRPRRAACCGCCTTARSPTTRRGCCAWRATRRGWGCAVEPHTARARRGGRRSTRSRGDRLGNEVRLLLARARPGRRAGRGRRVGRPGVPRPSPSWRATRCAAARRPGRTCSSWRAGRSGSCARRVAAGRDPCPSHGGAAAAARGRIPRSPRAGRAPAHRLQELGFTAIEVVRAHVAAHAPALAIALDARAAAAGRDRAPRRRRAVGGGRAGRRARPGRGGARWLDDLRHVTLEITGHDLLAAGVPEGPEIGGASARRSTGASTARCAGPRGRARGGPSLLGRHVPLARRAPRASRSPGATALFTTRRGGVSEGPFASAEPRALDRRRSRARATSNRERVAAAVGSDRPLARAARSTARACAASAHAGARGPWEEADGHATALRRRRADSCSSPTACRSRWPRRGRRGHGPRGLARAGRRHRRGGRRRAARAGRDGSRAAIGPGGGAVLLRGGRRGPRARSPPRPPPGATLDLKAIAARARSQAAGVARSTTPGCARSCEPRAVLLPPPRRAADRAPGGGRVAALTRPERVRANLEREVAARRSAPRTSRSSPRRSTSPLEDLGALAEAGVTLAGENRAQDLEAKADAHPELDLGLHRPPAEPQGQADPAARAAHALGGLRLRPEASSAKHGTPETAVLVEVNVAGEDGKSGHRPGRARPRSSSAVAVARRRPDDDAAASPRTPRTAAAGSPRCASSAGATACGALMGTTQDYARRRAGGRDDRPDRVPRSTR